MSNLNETAADVAALIPRYSWEIMDEEQRDGLMENVVLPRYMKTTADGAQLTPTWWADTVGASAAAIRNRVIRLRQTETETESERSRAVSDSRVRHARSALREADEETVREIVASLPEEARSRVVSAAVNASATPRPDGDANPLGGSLADVVKGSLTAQTSKLIALAARIDVLLYEGAQFSRVDAAARDRLVEDLERVQQTAGRLTEELRKQTKIRAVA